MADLRTLLQDQWADSCAQLDRILTSLTDAEFFWEPCDGCWTVHRRSETRGVSADGAGEWVIDYVIPEPDPAPVTTIAWRLVHIAAVNYLYWDYAFGSASMSFDLENPSTAESAAQWLTASQRPLTRTLEELTDEALGGTSMTNWGEPWPTPRIFTTLIKEQTHHGAEISLLRDLYRNRATLT